MFRRTSSGRRRALRDERGQGLVEFAMVLPVLMLVLMGIIQSGMLFYNYIDLTSATRDGARKLAVSRTATDPAAVTKAAIAASTTIIKDASTTVTVPTPSAGWANAAGSDVTVTVSYPYKFTVMGVTFWSGPMTSSNTVRLE